MRLMLREGQKSIIVGHDAPRKSSHAPFCPDIFFSRILQGKKLEKKYLCPGL